MGPILQLWLPCLIAANAFALFWLFKAICLTQALPWTKFARNPTDSSELAAAADGATADSPCCNSSRTWEDGQLAVGTGSQLDIPRVPNSADRGKGICSFVSHMGPLQLEWQALGCSYKCGEGAKVVLHDVWGKAHAGQMHALVGPSGAGKSTLLDMLAMRKSIGTLTGRLLVNGQPASAGLVRYTSYVPQDDTFIPTMTCQETLSFYACVTLGSSWTKQSRKQRAQEVLKSMGLQHAGRTLVGGTLPGGLNLRGLSGGERKRLSVAAGILGAPSLLFLDEPTSGLDSFAAFSVMSHLQNLAQTNKQTVIATIHQPRSAIWQMFDSLSLLALGRLLFHGPLVDLVPWFASLGYSHIKGSDCDWVLDLVATGFSKPVQQFGPTLTTPAEVFAVADAFCEQHLQARKNVHTHGSWTNLSSDCLGESISGGQAHGAIYPDKPTAWGRLAGMCGRRKNHVNGSMLLKSSASYPASWWAQFVALGGRELAGMTRNPFDVAVRVVTYTYTCLVYGLMAYNADFGSLQGVISRSNYIFASLQTMMLIPYVGISLYTNDKKIYLADASAKRCGPSAYYAAKVLVSLLFHIFCSVTASGIWYGMGGLRPGAQHFGRFAAVLTVYNLIACQVLHLCAVVGPNYDATFAMSVAWTAIVLLCSSFFVSFAVVSPSIQWLTQLRYISATYFALEALMTNEFKGGLLDCSKGLDSSQVQMLSSGLLGASVYQKAVIQQLARPQPECLFKEDVLLEALQFKRPFNIDMGILVGYLLVLHVLTFVGLLVLARGERR